MKRLKYESSVFENLTIKGVFDKTDNNQKIPFSFLKFSKPKSNYLINSGATYVIQSWNEKNGVKEKNLHTGLIPIATRTGTFLYGNNLNSRGKKDFVLLSIIGQTKVILYIVKNRNPRNKTKFSLELISQII